MRPVAHFMTAAGLLASMLLAIACSSLTAAPGAAVGAVPEQPPTGRDQPLLEGRIWLVSEARFVSREDLEARLAAARFILLGELHGHPEHHRLQAELIDALARRGRQPVIAMEQLDTDQAEALAAFQPATVEAAARLGEAVGWQDSGWPDWSRYQPIAEAAFRHALPLTAANLPRSAVRAVAMEGRDPRSLPDVDAGGLDTPLPAAAETRLRDILAASHCHDLPAQVIDRMLLAQRVRDVVMATRLQSAASPDGGVLIAGNGHIDRGFGIPWDLQRLGEDRIFSLALLPARPELDAPDQYPGDYDAIWFTPPHPEPPPDPCAGR